MIKMVSGEEIFASIFNVEGDSIMIEDPMKIFKRYAETDKGMSIQLNYEPFLDYGSTNRHTLQRHHIMVCEPLIPRLCVLYAEMKSTTKSIIEDLPIVPGNITVH